MKRGPEDCNKVKFKINNIRVLNNPTSDVRFIELEFNLDAKLHSYINQ